MLKKPVENGRDRRRVRIRTGGWLLLLVALLSALSIRPLRFSWHLLRSGIWTRGHFGQREWPRESRLHLLRAYMCNPSPYLLRKINVSAVRAALVENAIRRGDPQSIGRAEKQVSFLRGTRHRFRDNFFYRDLMGTLDAGEANGGSACWFNLDEVSFGLLADASYNRKSVPLLQRLAARFPRDFAGNLADFCALEGNPELSRWLMKHFNPTGRRLAPDRIPAISRSRSRYQLAEILGMPVFRPPAVSGRRIMGANLLDDRGNDSIQVRFFQNWMFLDQDAGRFLAGSFHFARDRIHGEYMVRLMGFGVQPGDRLHRARGGVCRRKFMPISQGLYLFSVDYRSWTGEESPSIWLNDGLPELRLPPSLGHWSKAVYLVDNRNYEFIKLRPLFRIWGTGTCWVNNFFLAPLSGTGWWKPKRRKIYVFPLSEHE